jgi:hypothetical protein
MKTKLTLVAPGKNDNYCGNFKERLAKNVNKNTDNIKKLNANDIRILIPDWGSPKDAKLSDVLEIDDHSYVDFLHIPFEITNPIATFSGAHVWNTAFRRTDSEYVMFLEGDTFIPFESLRIIKDLLDKDLVKFTWGSRYQIPYDVHSNCKSFRELDEKISEWEKNKHIETTNEIGWKFHGGWFHNKINLAGGDPGGATSLLIHRDIYNDCRGSYELLTKWGWNDIELHQRISKKYKYDPDLEEFGAIQFTQESTSQGFGGHINGMNPHLNSPTFEANDENWGLGNIDLVKYNKTSI